MQKKFVALAIAGLASGGVLAQSNVSIYGVIDTGMESKTVSSHPTAASNMTRTNVIGGQFISNRLGFKGSEDLGGGMKANFVIETAISTDAPAASTLGDRAMTIGLSGSFGQVNLGRQYTPMFHVVSAADAFNYAGSAATGSASAASIIGANTTSRQSNSIRWDSPKWSGVTAAVLWTAGTEGTTTATNTFGAGWGWNLRYANGPLTLGYAYDRASPTAASGGDTDRNAVSGSYNFGPATLLGGYITNKVGRASTVSNAVTYLGVRVPVSTAGMVRVQWGQMNDKLAANADQQFWSLGYSHSLSKRTTAYMQYGNFDNKVNTAVGDWRNLQAGINHKF
ncbi:MAG: porin [Sulfuritalea sp.]|nr:porin [Sulfuritalea sp.]